MAGIVDLGVRIEIELLRVDDRAPANVVVAGEASRGKSSLINALVGWPDLLPVDVDVATNTYVVVQPGLSPEAEIYQRNQERGFAVPVEELAEWVAEGGRSARLKNIDYAVVTVPSPLLDQGLCLIDTPGVGGLNTAHGETTLAALRQADALVFLLDSGAPLSKSELEFLNDAADRIDTVLLLLTKTDARPGWRIVLEENRDLLRGRGSRFADEVMLPVSARTARLAAEVATTNDPDLLAELRAEAGLDAVVSRLVEDVAMRAVRLRLANGTRLAIASLERLIATCDRGIATLSGDPQPLMDLRQRQRDLEEQTVGARRWRRQWVERFARLERGRIAALQDEMAKLREAIERDILERWHSGRQEAIAAEIEADLARLQVRVQSDLSDEVLALVGDQAKDLGVAELDVRAGQLALPERDRLTARRVNSFDLSSAFNVGRQTMSVGGGAFLKSSVPGFAAFLGGPTLAAVGPALGLASGALALLKTRRINQQIEARRVLAESLAQFQRDAGLAIGDLIKDMRDEAERQIDDELQKRIAVLNNEVNHLTVAAQQAERSQRDRSTLETKRRSLCEAADNARKLLVDLSGESNATLSLGNSTTAPHEA
ncbi:dynamin family protein [Actinomycetospora straminea]|uniref:dynamin family protein n=1 Tax=Actinomycetospora straminea TaxID=663607 RepID=UPI0023662A90|nr:dynamin family protein [Actinomycetospora straminea]MDD7936756.1 dynamin family protein [Actinomycetospora straminea]